MKPRISPQGSMPQLSWLDGPDNEVNVIMSYQGSRWIFLVCDANHCLHLPTKKEYAKLNQHGWRRIPLLKHVFGGEVTCVCLISLWLTMSTTVALRPAATILAGTPPTWILARETERGTQLEIFTSHLSTSPHLCSKSGSANFP